MNRVEYGDYGFLSDDNLIQFLDDSSGEKFQVAEGAPFPSSAAELQLNVDDFGSDLVDEKQHVSFSEFVDRTAKRYISIKAPVVLKSFTTSTDEGALRACSYDGCQDADSRSREGSFSRNSFGEISGEGVSYLTLMGKLADYALIALWQKIHHNLKVATPKFGKAQQIRDWLDVPENRAHLKKFRAIDLSGTGIQVIPRELCYFTQLETLTLNDNKIAMIPDFICELPLRRLYLKNNEITRLPASVANMTHLYQLDLAGNPIFSKPDVQLRKFYGLSGDDKENRESTSSSIQI